MLVLFSPRLAMLQNVKKAVAFLLLVVLIAIVGKGWHIAKGGFAIPRIRPFYLTLQASEPPSSVVKQALDQTYKYLGRGRQCYAFVSADGKYVLKLPRFDRFFVPFWLRALPFRERRRALSIAKEKRYHFTLDSFRIADEVLKEESALLYVHLGKTEFFQKKVSIVDRIGRSFFLSLDQTAFLLQEKKPLMMPLFFDCLKKGNREEAKEMLEAFFALITSRARKGIFNKDPTFFKNFGYDRGKAVQIDVGSFYRKDEGVRASLQETVDHFQNSLMGIDPEVLSWFERRSKEILEEC